MSFFGRCDDMDGKLIEWAANLNWSTKNSSGIVFGGYLSGIEPVGRHRAGFILLYILSQNTNGGHPCIGRFSFICADHDTKISRQVSPMVKLGGGWSG